MKCKNRRRTLNDTQFELHCQSEPDIKVPLNHEDFLSENDTQLDAAVKEMLKEIGEK